jgi:hypothetical protein
MFTITKEIKGTILFSPCIHSNAATANELLQKKRGLVVLSLSENQFAYALKESIPRTNTKSNPDSFKKKRKQSGEQIMKSNRKKDCKGEKENKGKLI